jgi:hypothetical protein
MTGFDESYVQDILRVAKRLPPMTRSPFRASTQQDRTAAFGLQVGRQL